MLLNRLIRSGACILLAAFLLVAGCGGSGQSSPPVSVPLVGSWGASDVNAALQLSSTGGRLTLYCGWGGPLNQAVIPDASGQFDVPGTFNSNVPNRPARYRGVVNGNTISLTVVLTDTTPNSTWGSFTLISGQSPPSTSPFGAIGACPG